MIKIPEVWVYEKSLISIEEATHNLLGLKKFLKLIFNNNIDIYIFLFSEKFSLKKKT